MDEVNCAGGIGCMVHDLITCRDLITCHSNWWYYPPTDDEFAPPSELSRSILCAIYYMWHC